MLLEHFSAHVLVEHRDTLSAGQGLLYLLPGTENPRITEMFEFCSRRKPPVSQRDSTPPPPREWGIKAPTFGCLSFFGVS